MKQFPENEFNEQLYVNAELGFSIKHPLDWHRKAFDSLSPAHQDGTVYWNIADIENTGTLSVRSAPKQAGFLSNGPDFLQTHPEIEMSQTVPLQHPAGQAIKYIGEGSGEIFWVILIAGKWNDLTMTFSYPQERATDSMTKLFDGIILSLRELEPAGNGPME